MFLTGFYSGRLNEDSDAEEFNEFDDEESKEEEDQNNEEDDGIL